MTDTPSPADAQEIEATGHYVAVDLCGKTLEVVPTGAWRQSAMRKLRVGDMDGFLEDVLSPDSYERYLELDPTNDDLNAFLETAGSSSGDTLGKSSGSTRPSRSTRRK
ncbi:hypothetical protein [Streptomyces fradiae]|uniref:hypothetical protein n=1 Tax=Streptomyces fradiae TaxID=1906 RepID=UPI0036F69A36